MQVSPRANIFRRDQVGCSLAGTQLATLLACSPAKPCPLSAAQGAVLKHTNTRACTNMRQLAGACAQGGVQNLEDLKSLIRYNNYREDTYSGGWVGGSAVCSPVLCLVTEQSGASLGA